METLKAGHFPLFTLQNSGNAEDCEGEGEGEGKEQRGGGQW
jgi:hypothetical protein